eukprot:3696547-Rhodomonas_salina.1
MGMMVLCNVLYWNYVWCYAMCGTEMGMVRWEVRYCPRVSCYAVCRVWRCAIFGTENGALYYQRVDFSYCQLTSPVESACCYAMCGTVVRDVRYRATVSTYAMSGTDMVYDALE